MKRPLATLAACAALLVCSACSQNEPPMPPETERVYASVLADCGGDEYMIDVRKDSDTLARYTLMSADGSEPMTFAFVGNECTVTYMGLELTNPPESAPVTVLHKALCARSALEYDESKRAFCGVAENFAFIFYVSSGSNPSILEVNEPKFKYCFDLSLR